MEDVIPDMWKKYQDLYWLSYKSQRNLFYHLKWHGLFLCLTLRLTSWQLERVTSLGLVFSRQSPNRQFTHAALCFCLLFGHFFISGQHPVQWEGSSVNGRVYVMSGWTPTATVSTHHGLVQPHWAMRTLHVMLYSKWTQSRLTAVQDLNPLSIIQRNYISKGNDEYQETW